MISRRSLVLALLAGLAGQGGAQAQSLRGRYFVVVWSYQGAVVDPTEAHTFATFYRGDDLSQGRVRPATISWLPATGVVRFSGVEKGRNFSLGATLALARRYRFGVVAFGPYEVSARTFANALARVRLLNSGKVAYTMINGPDGAMNCIEAAGSVAGPISPGLNYGPSVSAVVAQHLAVHAGQADREAAERLQLARYVTGS